MNAISIRKESNKKDGMIYFLSQFMHISSVNTMKKVYDRVCEKYTDLALLVNSYPNNPNGFINSDNELVIVFQIGKKYKATVRLGVDELGTYCYFDCGGMSCDFGYDLDDLCGKEVSCW